MGYEIHEKQSTQGTQYRVWDTRSNEYWHKPVIKTELENALLEDAVWCAIGDVVRQFQTNRLRTTQVSKWYHQSKDDTGYPEKYWTQRLAELYGANISIEIQMAPDDIKTITAKVEPLAR